MNIGFGGGEASSGHNNNENEDVCLDDEYIELTKETLLQIENNDPSITSLKLKGDGNDFPYTVGEWRRVHNAIGNNTHIKRFEISNYLDSDLCYGIANNRSITHLHLEMIYDLSEEMLSILSPIFENNDVRSLHIIQCEVGGEQNKDSDSVTAAIASTLSKFSTLTSFNLAANQFDKVQSAKIVGALRGHPNLADIDLGMNYLSIKGCVELGKVLKVCKVKKLDLGYCDINNECAAILVNALQGNTTLKELSLDGNNSEHHDDDLLDATGWGALFSLLTSVPLEDFSVYNTNIIDKGALLLADKLTNNSTLKSLNLGSTHFLGPSGWRAIFTGLQTTSALEKLVITETRGINDSHLPLLWNVIKNCPLKELEINNCPHAAYSDSISAQGLQAMARMLECPDCELEKLDLRGEHHFNDDVITEFVRRLVNNTCLKVLGISGSKPLGSRDRKSKITMRGWEALSALLCDVSSIDNTYSSKHTLSVSIDRHSWTNNSRLPNLSNINKNNNRSDAAREKIMKYHFTASEQVGALSNGMQVVSKMDLVVLPQAIAWAGRKHDNEGCTILYQLLRCIPELVEDQTLTKSVAGKKRKLN